jgi:hypothetical protein
MVDKINNRFGYMLNVVNQTYTDRSQELRTNPKAMWEIATAAGTILGRLPENWFGIFPTGASVPEDSPNAVQFMIAPQGQDRFLNIADLTASQLDVGFRFAQEFLRSAPKDAVIPVAGWNISSEPVDRKPQPQSWPNLHIHCLYFPKQMDIAPFIPLRSRDLGWQSAQASVLSTYLKKFDGPWSIASTEEMTQQFPDFNFIGGIALKLKPEIGGEVMKTVDDFYRDFHKKFFGLFVSNYDEVKASSWKIPYQFRSESDFKAGVTGQFDEEMTKYLLDIGKRLKKDDPDSKNARIYRSPAYSVGLLINGEGSYYLHLDPKLLSGTGFTEPLGLNTQRFFVADASYENRLKNARNTFQQITDSLSQSQTGSHS